MVCRNSTRVAHHRFRSNYLRPTHSRGSLGTEPNFVHHWVALVCCAWSRCHRAYWEILLWECWNYSNFQHLTMLLSMGMFWCHPSSIRRSTLLNTDVHTHPQTIKRCDAKTMNPRRLTSPQMNVGNIEFTAYYEHCTALYNTTDSDTDWFILMKKIRTSSLRKLKKKTQNIDFLRNIILFVLWLFALSVHNSRD